MNRLFAFLIVACAPSAAMAQTLGDVIDRCVAAVRENDSTLVDAGDLRSYQGSMLGYAEVEEGRVGMMVDFDASGTLWKCSVVGYDPRDDETVRSAWISRRAAEPALAEWFAKAATQPDSAGMQMLVPGEHGLATCLPGDVRRGWLVTATTQISFGVQGVEESDLPVWVTVNRALPGNVTPCERMGR